MKNFTEFSFTDYEIRSELNIENNEYLLMMHTLDYLERHGIIEAYYDFFSTPRQNDKYTMTTLTNEYKIIQKLELEIFLNSDNELEYHFKIYN